MDSFQNVASNSIAPVDVRKGSLVLGAAEYIAVEVAVSKIVRSVLNMENRGIFELAFIHALSIPLLGGLGAPFSEQKSILSAAGGYTQAFYDGAKGIPAVLAAQWVVATASRGFHLPWFTFKDLLITAGSKAITRPLVFSVANKLPDTLQDGFLVIDALVQRQVAVSNLKMK